MLEMIDAPESLRARMAALPIEFLERRWYAAHVLSRHEHKITQQLTERLVEHFLPQYESLRRWKDRSVKLQLPLFPGYLFVRLALRDRLRVLQIPSVARLVAFNGHPTVVPDREIETLRATVAYLRAEPHAYLKAGRRVRIRCGPLEGVEGILVRRKNKLRVVLSLDVIARSAAVEVDAGDIEQIS